MKRKDYISWDEYFMGIALLSAKRSKDPSTQVGACIVSDKNKIVGVLQWHVKENAAHGLAEIEEVLILENYRGQGTGSLLVLCAIDAIRSYFVEYNIKPRKIFLFVGKENTPARKLYEKHGFKFISSIGYVFQDNVEELFYSLEL